jgi:hypothetical protein
MLELRNPHRILVGRRVGNWTYKEDNINNVLRE